MTGLIEVGELVRELGASAALAVEDELDWEHLPHVHASTFSAISLVHADNNGWEADVVLADGAPLRMRVTIDADRLGYANATFSDGVENGRAVARIEATGPNSCRMHMRFFAPDTPQTDRDAAGAFYRDVFGRILDEDEPKMKFRAQALRDGPSARRRRRTVTLADGATCEVPVVCPHQGLPLDCEPDATGVMTCPWHGYRFDARTGACLSGRTRGWTNNEKS
ncbi:MAG: Uncharacterized protein FD124_2345 [Alphaproteobacteria bacterium]|nr:MAG: Uncharacterized protein FD160_301 [Caulobacteraceae bacterium]TPW05071.1 MAG: Uncharacterized protein FD124_2345 [Alphaproteobacteria bacterium]